MTKNTKYKVRESIKYQVGLDKSIFGLLPVSYYIMPCNVAELKMVNTTNFLLCE